MGANPDNIDNNNNNNNPKSFQRMGSLGNRARTFFSKFKQKSIRKLHHQGSGSSNASNDNNNNNNNETQESEKQQQQNSPTTQVKVKGEEEDVVIVGAGIVGLVLALSLHTHAGITPKVYEQAPAFHDDVGAGMGMYPNGLRVIRDLSPDLLKDIQDAGYPYLYRRWERHDGTEIAIAQETVLTTQSPKTKEVEDGGDGGGDPDLHPLGIRRWRLQKLLFQAAEASGIKIHFNKQLQTLEQQQQQQQQIEGGDSSSSSSSTATSTKLIFQDGTSVIAKVVLGADGSKSKIRETVLKQSCAGGSEGEYPKLTYTGVTCLMGTSNIARVDRGICLPASETTKCHGAFYPTGPDEQCFQFHFPTLKEDAEKHGGSWGTLTELVGQEECTNLRHRLEADGWSQKYLQPLENVDKAIKIAFSTLQPPLESYVHGQHHNIVLVGDAAHPPVPYLGQGAQQGLEDAGTLAMLFEHLLMIDDDGGDDTKKKFSTTNLSTALKLYNTLRVPRTHAVLENSMSWGKQQQKRTMSPKYNSVKEEKIQRDVFFHETNSVLLLGVHHDYKEEVLKAMHDAPLLAVPEEE